MTREILYKKTSFLKEKPREIKVEKLNMADWLKVRPLINISALCREAGVNRSNFDKYLKMKSIPKKYEVKLVDILKKYGY